MAVSRWQEVKALTKQSKSKGEGKSKARGKRLKKKANLFSFKLLL